MRKKIIPIAASLSISMTLILQAVAAHAIANAENQKLIEKAAAMQMNQSLGLLLMALLLKRLTLSMGMLAVGIVLFCGTLYAKGFSLIDTSGAAPLGGSLMILSWIVFAIEIVRDQNRNS